MSSMLNKQVEIKSNQVALQRLNNLKNESPSSKLLSYFNKRIDWDELVNITFMPYLESNIGRLIIPTESMLKIYFLQRRYGMSAANIEKALSEVESLRKFALDIDIVPSAVSINEFSQLLSDKNLIPQIEQQFNV